MMHSSMRGTLLSWRGLLCWQKKKKKRLGRLLCYAFFKPFRMIEIGEPLRIVKAWTKQLVLFWVRMYIRDASLLLLNFGD